MEAGGPEVQGYPQQQQKQGGKPQINDVMIHLTISQKQQQSQTGE